MPFTFHWFSAAHTRRMTDNLLETLKQNEVVIIQDFSENYSCLLLSEPETLHWTTQQATMYPVVAIFVENGALKEDHFDLSMKH